MISRGSTGIDKTLFFVIIGYFLRSGWRLPITPITMDLQREAII
jgi:hypothetical protein